MRKALAVAVILSFGVTSPAFAAGPLEASAKRVAQRFAQQTSTQGVSSGRGLTWAGVALIGSGVALIALANTAAKKEECVETRVETPVSLTVGIECIEETNNALAWGGLAAAGLGATLTVIGIRKNVQIGIGASSAAVSVKF